MRRAWHRGGSESGSTAERSNIRQARICINKSVTHLHTNDRQDILHTGRAKQEAITFLK